VSAPASGSELRGVLHPVVVTGDMARTLAFYRDVIGFRVRAEMTHDPDKLARLGGPPHARATAVVLTAPDCSELEIACFTAPRGRARSDAAWADAGIRSLTLVVVDLVSMLNRMRRAGYPPVGEVVSFEVDGRSVRVVYVHGPDGVVLTFLEREG
jgi:catechol 2,3-dioxygenase-like lactoylglutathione lyase family enzyme